MKHIHFILLSVLFMIVGVNANAQDTEDFTIDGIKYTGDKTTMTATVTTVEDRSGLTDAVIPETVNGYTVTAIGEWAFTRTAIETIALPNGLKEIGGRAFHTCEHLKHINIPNSVTKIGELCFVNCKSLVSVVLPESLQVIESNLFAGCENLESVNIPNSVTEILYYSFFQCSKLKSLYIPASVRVIQEMFGYNPFCYCDGLEEIVVDPDNPVFDSRDNCNGIIESATDKLIAGFKVTQIPDGVRIIGNRSFSYIGIEGQIEELVIPGSVTEIEEYAFFESGLVSINVPNTVKTIGAYAFGTCESLVSISLPNTLTKIPKRLFQFDTKLRSVQIPASVTSIDECAFIHCSSLESIEIPKNVLSIGNGAFRGCNGLKTIISKIEEPFEISEDVFQPGKQYAEDELFSTVTLYVPNGTREKYEATAGWNKFQTIREEGELEEPITLTADNLTITYGDEIPTLTYTIEGTTLNGQPQIECAATADSPAGEYPITVSVGTVINRNVTYVNGTLTIAKAPLTIKAVSYTKKQDEPLPTFEATYEGFKNGETEEVLTTRPTFSCEATATSAPGTYDIVVSGAEAQNYEISYEKGTLTVEVLKGDVTDDGFLDSKDVIALVNYILGRGTLANEAAANVNGDETLDIADVAALVEIILGISGTEPVNPPEEPTYYWYVGNSRPESVDTNNIVTLPTEIGWHIFDKDATTLNVGQCAVETSSEWYILIPVINNSPFTTVLSNGSDMTNGFTITTESVDGINYTVFQKKLTSKKFKYDFSK